MGKDFYAILGVPKTATADEIKKAYNKGAMKWHPDRHMDDKETATKKFQEIAEAYEVLRDDQKRKVYDQFGEEGLKQQGQGFEGGQYSNVRAEELFRNMFGNFGGFSGGSRNKFHFQDSGSDEDNFFGGGFGKRPFGAFHGGGFSDEDEFPMSQRKKPDPLIHDVNVSLEDLYNQATKKVKMTRSVEKQQNYIVQEEKILEFKCVPGLKEGTKITFEKEGDQFMGKIPADVIFKVHLKTTDKSEKFTSVKSNLIVVKDITLLQALKSYFNVNITTLDGRQLKVSVSDSVTPKYEKVVPGEGLPTRSGKRGDLIIRFNIQFPTSLTDNQKKDLENILKPNQ
jgi:DnaJ family protein B protein 4